MTEEFKQMVIDALRRGDGLPREWARELFPPDKREYELLYYDKEREEDILANTMALPLQPVSSFGANAEAWHNMLLFGDNLQAMKTLLQMKQNGELANADGTPGVRLVYIDPPFATKQEFRGSQDQKAYQDKIAGAEFLEFLRKRLILLRELLSDDGLLYLHLDWKKGHYAKILLDEVFGEHNFVNEIIWQKIRSSKGQALSFGNVHDTIFCYAKSPRYVFNKQYKSHDPERLKTHYNNVEDGTGRRYQLADFTQAGQGEPRRFGKKVIAPPKGKHWIWSQEKIDEGIAEGRIVFTSGGKPRVKRYLDESEGAPVEDIWTDIPPINSQSQERLDYPTQKPERLIARIINASSNKGDIVLDAFVGSGTVSAVAEKLGRRWIGIDCGKLAIYTVQKRMLNLRSSIGNTGRLLHVTPFTLYNAGLYDFSTLRQLSWTQWRFFALQLFGCKDQPHTIGGLHLDGKLKGASVLVFNHIEQPGRRIDEETIREIHAAVGKRIGRKFFIIAPRGVFDFQHDYIDLDGIRYYALRIPYSVINELHHRDFTALQQPNDESAVNETVDAVGFDFIQPPRVKWDLSVKKRKGEMFDEACLTIKHFESRARIRGKDTRGGLETLSMLMIDFNLDGKVFDLDAVFFANQLQSNKWQAWFPIENLGEQFMLVFIDIYGNEARELVSRDKLGIPSKKTPKRKKKTRK